MKQWYQGQDRLSDKSQEQLPSNRASDKKVPDAYTGARFDYCRSVFPQSVRKAGPNVDLYNVPSAASSSTTWVPSTGRVNSGKLRACTSRFPQMKSSTSPTTLSCHFSENFGGNNYAHVILTAEADSLPTDEKELLDDNGLVGCHSSRSNDLSVHARIDSSGYIRLFLRT